MAHPDNNMVLSCLCVITWSAYNALEILRNILTALSFLTESSQKSFIFSTNGNGLVLAYILRFDISHCVVNVPMRPMDVINKAASGRLIFS